MRPNTGQCMRDVRAHRASAGSAYWWVQSPPPNLSGGPTRFRIEVFSSVKDAEASWRAAEAAGVCYGFECFEWLSTWQETIGTFEAVKPCIVRVVDEDSVTVMLLPLGIRRYFGWTILSFLGGQLSDYNAPILRADFARNVGAVQFNVLWEEVLRRLPPIDMICLARLPKYIDGVENPFTRLPGAQHHANSHFAILENSFLQFQCGRSPHFRKDTKRQRRRLEKIGEVSFRVASTTTEVAATMAALVRQRFDQGRELGYRTTFHIPAYRIFYEKMALEHYHHGLIQVCALFVNNKIIAAHWGMKYRNRLYWLMPAYERGSCAKYSPGRLLLENLLEWCFNNHVAVFDLTVGDEPYKLQWADRSMALFELDQSRSAKGLVLVYARRLLFHIKDRIKRYPRLFALLRRARRLFGISHWSPL